MIGEGKNHQSSTLNLKSSHEPGQNQIHPNSAAGFQTGQTGQGDERGQTAWLNTEANDLHDKLLDIQNAPDLEWPADDPANVAVRAKFLLGVFPYGNTCSGTTPKPTPAPQAAK